jgi:hypothetical protein
VILLYYSPRSHRYSLFISPEAPERAREYRDLSLREAMATIEHHFGDHALRGHDPTWKDACFLCKTIAKEDPAR